MSTFFLFESSLGYCLFEIKGYEEISQKNDEFQGSIMDFKKVSAIVTKKAFIGFTSSGQALENTKCVVKRILTDELIEFLKMNLPIKKKSMNFKLAVADKKFAQQINEKLGIPIQVGDFVVELSRAIRCHLHKFLGISEEDLIKSELGLGHSYSRMKCMFDVNRQDKPVVQSIALIDLLDKDINGFCMRIKEWFGWHFPELSKIVPDNYVYVRISRLIETRHNLLDKKDELMPELDQITLDNEISKQITDAAATSMGSDISDIDLLNVKYFSEKVAGLIRYREELCAYLKDKMKKLAPNVSALVGEIVAARLISHAGSLSTLAKYPASTIQILGAEKALFRALKTRSKTPKYGLLYHSSFIGKAKTKNKGKISRYLANKLAMCARIDFFSTERFNDYGNELKNQIEERLKFLDTGVKPRKNVDVMKQVFERLNKAKVERETETETEIPQEEKLLKKKRKKSKPIEEKEEEEGNQDMIIKEEVQVEEEMPKKKKKKKKSLL